MKRKRKYPSALENEHARIVHFNSSLKLELFDLKRDLEKARERERDFDKSIKTLERHIAICQQLNVLLTAALSLALGELELELNKRTTMRPYLIWPEIFTVGKFLGSER